MQEKKVIITTFQALEKLRKYCAYSERSHFDVRSKLKQWNIDETASESIISSLIEERFLNEERYTEAYVHGKIRINHWGKNKIKQGLRQHKISEPCIKRAFAKIDFDEYIEVLIKEGHKKLNLSKGTNSEKQQKTIQFLISKGFEFDLIKEQSDHIFKSKES